MENLTVFEITLKNQDFITAFGDKTIKVIKKEKTYCAYLYVSENKVYAVSGNENDPVIKTIILTNGKTLGRPVRSTDKIKVTQILPTAVIGEIAGP